jgi:integrase
VQGEVTAGHDPFAAPAQASNLSLMSSRYVEDRKPFWGQRTAPLHTHTLKLLMEAVSDVPVTSLDKAHVRRFTEYIKKRGACNTGKPRPLTASTLNIHLRNLRAFLRWAGEEAGWNPPRVSEVPVPSSGHRDYYSIEECRKLVSAASEIFVNGQPLSGLLSVLLLTGMRKSEVLNMEWSWIDWKTQQILVPPEITKTKHKRAIPMTRALSGLLSTWPRIGDRVFSLSGSSGHLDVMYHRAIQQAGIRRLKLHNLRDTFAVQSLLSGVPLAVVSAILGHACVVTTIKHYASIAGDELRIAADRNAGFSTAILLQSGES